MQGHPQVIAALNRVLGNELVAINQYFLHARMLRHRGILALAKHEYDESIEEMKHADFLIERILFLDGLPNLQDLGKLHIGEDVAEILRADLQVEVDAIPALKEGILICEDATDFISRDLLKTILADEEEHIDWLETQLQLIDTIGIENYIQSKLGDINEK